MSDYYLSKNPLSDGDVFGFQSNFDDSPAFVSRQSYRNSTASTPPLVRLQQSRCINQNNQRSLSWNISLTDDQDEVSQHFLRMYDEPKLVTEKFGPDILIVPENLRKQADELFEPSEINPYEIFDSVPEIMERHAVYPNNHAAHHGPQPHRLSFNSDVVSPVASSNRSSLSSFSSPSSLYTLATAMYGRSPGSSGNNNNNNNDDDGDDNNSSRSNNSINSSNNNYHDNGYGPTVVAADASSADAPSCWFVATAGESSSPYWWTSSPQQQQQQQHHRQLQRQHQHLTRSDPWAAPRSPSDRGRPASSSADPRDCDGRSPLRSASGWSRWPSRLYFCVNTDNNTINKLVEHYCTFCYKNLEPPEVYGSHLVRDATRTTCPKLRALRCKHCNGTGDNAHTIKYCPFLYANYS